MNTVPYQLTPTTLTVILDGRPEVLRNDSTQYDSALATLSDATLSQDECERRLREIVRPVVMIQNAVDDDRVSIVGRRVLFDGEGIPTAMTRKLLDVANAGLDIAPWKRFVVRVFSNPSRAAQAELNEFLEAADLPLTVDGCFLAYKRVTDDYLDLHSRTFDNSVGQVVSMPREDVDPDRDRTCSRGLHFCSQDYLKHFYSGGGRIMVVKVDPADVVSIPSDYQFTKGRTWRYEVVGEVPLTTESEKAEWGVYDDIYVEWDEDSDSWDDIEESDEGWDDPWGDYADEWGDSDDEDEVSEEPDEAPVAETPVEPVKKVSRFRQWLNGHS